MCFYIKTNTITEKDIQDENMSQEGQQFETHVVKRVFWRSCNHKNVNNTIQSTRLKPTTASQNKMVEAALVDKSEAPTHVIHYFSPKHYHHHLQHFKSKMCSSSLFHALSSDASMDLRTVLNACKYNSPSYTRLADLYEECGYPITNLEIVTSSFGEAVVATLEGQVGDDFYLRVYLPRRFNQVLSRDRIECYNSGVGERLRLVKHSPQPGSNFTPLEFV